VDPECSHNPGPSLPSDLVAVLSLVVHHPFCLQDLLLLDWLRLASSPSCLFLSVSNCERVCTEKSSRYTIAFDVFAFSDSTLLLQSSGSITMRQDYRDYASRADVLIRCRYVMAVDVIIDDGTSVEVRSCCLR
jgi:hypothetical protein